MAKVNNLLLTLVFSACCMALGDHVFLTNDCNNFVTISLI